MTSKLAQADCDRLKSQGIDLSFIEIVRLNALGCRAELSAESIDVYAMPRCAFIESGGRMLTFREATIGHELWLAKVAKWYDMEDPDTAILVRAFALTRDQSELPKWDDRDAVVDSIQQFMAEASPFTPRQAVACINYVTLGDDPNDWEEPVRKTDEGDKAPDGLCDGNHSVGIGIMHRGMATRLGLTLEDYLKMTPSQVQCVVSEAIQREAEGYGKAVRQHALGDYVATLNAIKANHSTKAGKDNG